jgi:site-specific DNA-methyltransferase (adenine-specific)
MNPYHERDGITIYQGDCREGMAELAENSVDAIVTDPPYGLEFMGKDWDRLIDYHSQYDHKRPENRGQTASPYIASKVTYRAGLAAQEWHYAWAVAALRVLKPGGHLLAFGGTRTHHRLWCALEDAGFEIRDTLCWLYGSGFPKSLDVSKAIDKAAGAKREVVGQRPGTGSKRMCGEEAGKGFGPIVMETLPVTDAARQWDGFGTALKPSHEPVVLARKPLSEPNIAANVLKHGTGGINIDGCRVGVSKADTEAVRSSTHGPLPDHGWGFKRNLEPVEYHPAGRFPANLVLSCTCEETREARVKGTNPGLKQGKCQNQGGPLGGGLHEAGRADYADPDGKEAVTVHTDPNCPCYLLDAQSGETPSNHRLRKGASNIGQMAGLAGQPPNGSGYSTERGHVDSGGASRFFFQAKASTRERAGSKHPTIKPLALMRYLCRLVTPPNGIVLDPFAGSGTTLEAARLEGFRCIGIEMNEEYCADAERRLRKYLL